MTRPKAVTFKTPQDDIQLIIHGQGVTQFYAVLDNSLTFYDPQNVNGIQIRLTSGNVEVRRLPSGELLTEATTKGHAPLGSPAGGATYWFSLDAQNQRLQAGLGEARIETAIYKYQLTHADKPFLESLTHVKARNATVFRLLRDPITRRVPLIIRPTDDLSMDDIAGGMIVAKSHLTPTGQKLFNCVSGRKFILDAPDFPDFSKAIERSIADPHGWCHKRLKEKSREFDKDHPNELETYLRITIGENNGESPGIPYVMEIWPPQHYSPIHNHGDSNAIIRVLHGEINVSLYPYLCAFVEPFAVTDFKKDDITWLSRNLNQVHKLTNNKTETCITIQCYLYEEDDQGHYDYFDYLDGQGRTQQYEPDSDKDFVDFKALMKQEWMAFAKASAEVQQPKRNILQVMTCRGV